MKSLTDNPHDIYFCGDDVEVRMRILQMGLGDQVERNLARAREAGKKKYGFRVYEYGHQTHWIAIDFFMGFDRPEDNGYMLIAVSKSKFSRAAFMSQIPVGENFTNVDHVISFDKVPVPPN